MQATNNRMRTIAAITTMFCLFLATSGIAGLTQTSTASEIVKLMHAADAGDGRAMFSLGFKYLNGLGVQRDDTVAATWFQTAAEAGDRNGMAYLGWCHEAGRGVPQDNIKAATWYYRAAEAGSVGAMTNLGVLLRFGRGVPWNEPEAMEWFKRAAEMGSARAQTQLGLGYMNGLGGGVQNYFQARDWFAKAARQGDASAQLSLGILYQNGWGVDRDFDTAKSLYAEAAKSDDPQIAKLADENTQKLLKASGDLALGTLLAGALVVAIMAGSSNSGPSNLGTQDEVREKNREASADLQRRNDHMLDCLGRKPQPPMYFAPKDRYGDDCR